MRIVDEATLRGRVTVEAAIAAVEAAFAALARGEARLPPPINLDIPEAAGEVHVKGGHLAGSPYYAFKLATGFYRNAERGLPTGSGLVFVGDAATGLPAALLLDNGWLTDLRTGAAGAVAARHLALPGPGKVAVIGAGVQARLQLRCLAAVRPLGDVAVWSRTPEHAATCHVMAAKVRASGEGCPEGYDLASLPHKMGDLVVVDGKDYPVDGQPDDWTRGPWANPVAGITVYLRRVEG